MPWHCLLLAALALAADEPKAVPPLALEVRQLLGQLDHDEFAARDAAARRLAELVAKPEHGRLLAEEFGRALVDPRLSFEVRSRLELWTPRLPRVALPAPRGLAPHEIDALLTQLDDDAYSVRQGAAKRLQWLLTRDDHVCAVLDATRRRLGQGNVNEEGRQQLRRLYDDARRAWLANEAAQCHFEPVSDAALTRLVDELLADNRPGALAAARAEKELLDLLARDDCLPRVAALLRARRVTADDVGGKRIDGLLFWTHPAMVAEYWEGRRHHGEQHLLVGVPSQAEGARRPSHFDWIDDRTARCVSGATLEPGEYPVGVAFPHPSRGTAFFHLVNLPTPRRRMAYAELVKRDAAVRLAEISRRTCRRWIERKETLTDDELEMLLQLDPTEVSLFAGEYLLTVADAPTQGAGRVGRPSRHGRFCTILASIGTGEAVPGLLRAIEKERLLRPTSWPPYELAWCAVLNIAKRDAGLGIEKTLAGLIHRSDPLVAGQKDGPELGATAAAVLLAGRGEDPEKYGIDETGILIDKPDGVAGGRFVDDDARRKVLQWWTALKDVPPPTGPPKMR